MKTNLSLKKSNAAIFALLIITIITQSSVAQATPKFASPFVNRNVTSSASFVYPYVKTLQSGILSMNKVLANQVFQNLTIPSTYVAPTNLPQEALNQTILFFTNISASIEPTYYNFTVYLSKVDSFVSSSYELYKTNYNNWIAVLQALFATINSDELPAQLILNNFNNNLATLNDTFNSFANNSAPLLASLNSLSAGYIGNATKFVNNANNTLSYFNDIYKNITVFAANTTKAIANQMNGIINNTLATINAANNTYLAFLANFTRRGAPQLNSFWNWYNLTCLPSEIILNTTLVAINNYTNYSAILSLENSNMMAATDQDAGYKFKNFFLGTYNRYLQFSAMASALTSGSTTGMNRLWTTFQAANLNLNNVIANIQNYILAENTYVNNKNNHFFVINPSGSANQFISQATTLLGNLAIVLDNPFTQLSTSIPVNSTNFYQLGYSIAPSYNLQFLGSFGNPPPAPPARTTPSGTTIAAIPTIPYSAAMSFSNVGAHVFAASSFTQNSPYPAPFSLIGAYDSTQALTNLYPASFPVTGNWLQFDIDVSSYYFASVPACFVTITAANLPNSPQLLSVSLNIAAAQTSVPAPQPVSNGWNNFVMAWKVIPSSQFVRIQLLVSDLNAAFNAGLQAQVNLISP